MSPRRQPSTPCSLPKRTRRRFSQAAPDWPLSPHSPSRGRTLSREASRPRARGAGSANRRVPIAMPEVRGRPARASLTCSLTARIPHGTASADSRRRDVGASAQRTGQDGAEHLVYVGLSATTVPSWDSKHALEATLERNKSARPACAFVEWKYMIRVRSIYRGHHGYRQHRR